mgnify:CR=1 FL=1
MRVRSDNFMWTLPDVVILNTYYAEDEYIVDDINLGAQAKLLVVLEIEMYIRMAQNRVVHLYTSVGYFTPH